MSKLWCGIDLGETTAHVCVIDDAGTVQLEAVCSPYASAIRQTLDPVRQKANVALAIEAGTSTRLARQMREMGFQIDVFEARKTRRFLEAFHHKTDAGDARGIAEIARNGAALVPKVYVKSPECQLLRSELLLRQKMLRQKVATQGMIRSLFRLHAGRTVQSGAGITLRQAAEEALTQLRSEEGLDLSDQIGPILDLHDSLARYLKAVDAKLADRAAAHPVCSRLMTLPGVGFLTALSFYSSVEDPERFHRTTSIGAYFGLVPRIHQSGTMKRQFGISKRGNKLTRTFLTMGAQSLLRPQVQDTAIKLWGKRLAQRAGKRKAQVAVARKLAIVMLALWKSGGEYKSFPLDHIRAY